MQMPRNTKMVITAIAQNRYDYAHDSKIISTTETNDRGMR